MRLKIVDKERVGFSNHIFIWEVVVCAVVVCTSESRQQIIQEFCNCVREGIY